MASKAGSEADSAEIETHERIWSPPASTEGPTVSGVSAVHHHVFSGERLQAFSDAVFSIVATIMVIPLKVEEDELHESFLLEEYLYNQYPKYFVYIFSFILVVDTWYSHARIFNLIERVDDVILWLNLFVLLLVSFLPYGLAVISRFQQSDPEGFGLAISTCSTIIILTGLLMVGMVLYSFRRQALLHPEIAGSTSMRSLRNQLLITLSVNPVLAVVAQLFNFSEKTATVALVFFYSMGIASAAVRIGFHFYNRRKHYNRPNFVMNIFRNVASKARTEAFSDGVFAIVATLIVLDLTTEIPSSDDVERVHGGNLRKALDTKRYLYLAYVSSFLTVGLLWVVQYGMFHFLKKITPMLSLVNSATLCLIGGIPFVSSVYVTFADEVSTESRFYNRENEQTAIRASTVLVLLAGVCQLLFWTIALFNRRECLYDDIARFPAEILTFLKIMIFPTISGFIFWLTFSEEVSVKHVYGYLVVTTPFIFLLVKSAFALYQFLRTGSTRRAPTMVTRLLNCKEMEEYRLDSRTASNKSPAASPINTSDTVPHKT